MEHRGVEAMAKLIALNVAAAVWVALLAGALIAQDMPRATVHGVVLSRETGLPIPGAMVSARGLERPWWRDVRADKHGGFDLREVTAGLARFTAHGAVHQMQKPVRVDLGESASNSVTLIAEPVAPFLRLRTDRRRQFAPDEPALLNLAGYSKSSRVVVEVRRLGLPDLPQSQGASSATRAISASPAPWERCCPSTGECSIPLRRTRKARSGPSSRSGSARPLLDLGRDPRRGGWVRGEHLAHWTGDQVRRAHRAWLRAGPDGQPAGRERRDGVPALREVRRFRPHRRERPVHHDRRLREGGECRLIARAGNSYALTDTYASTSASADAEGDQGGTAGEMRTYFYTDRPVYRPGQHVFFKGIVRRRVGAEYRVPAGIRVRLAIQDAGDSTVLEEDLTTNSFGSFHGDLALDPDAATGLYTAHIRIGEQEETGSFSVAEYRKPEYEVNVKAAKKQFVRGEPVRFVITARYYWGEPVRGARIRYTATRAPEWYVPDDDESRFLSKFYAASGAEEETTDTGFGEEAVSGEAVTDATGRLRPGVHAANYRKAIRQDYRTTVEADVTRCQPLRRPVERARHW